jgi:ubiquinone/menaquinone biosynthesis C-methylase UbiE
MKKSKNEYWRKYYNDNIVVCTNNFQKNVGRTISGIPVSEEIWDKTINYMVDLLNINKTKDVLELCCGNGQVIGNLSIKCKSATGVDYSEKLLLQLNNQFNNKVKSIREDVLKIAFETESVDIILIYFSIQHFDEIEILQLVKNCVTWLKKGGKLFIGDIPNELKKWEYIDEERYRRDYIERVLKNEPMIGNWYQPGFFKAIGDYFTEISIEVLQQPDYQVNSVFRFDVLIEKR